MTTKKRLISVLLAFSLLFCLTGSVYARADDVLPYQNSLFYTQGDYSIHYRVFPADGVRTGRILFIHGFLYSGSTWEDMVPYFTAAGYECVLADCPGFGYSTRESADIEHIDREELFAGLMRTMAPLENWIVAGHSMGGGIALNLACEYPQLKALMLYCPSAIVQQSDFSRKLIKSAPMRGFCTLLLKAAEKCLPLVRFAAYMASDSREYAENYELDKLLVPLAIDGTGESMCYMLSDSRATDMEKVKELSMPVFAAWGDNDRVLGASGTASLQAALSFAESETFEGGHLIIETIPEQLSAASLAFLAE